MPTAKVKPGAPLSQEEFNCAYLLSQGLIRKQVAERLGLNLHRVHHCIARVYMKLSINCVSELITWMEQEGV